MSNRVIKTNNLLQNMLNVTKYINKRVIFEITICHRLRAVKMISHKNKHLDFDSINIFNMNTNLFII